MKILKNSFELYLSSFKGNPFKDYVLSISDEYIIIKNDNNSFTPFFIQYVIKFCSQFNLFFGFHDNKILINKKP